MGNKKLLKIASIHWGFIPGGGAAYARSLEEVGRYAPIRIKSLCLTAPCWPLYPGSKSMDMDLVRIGGRLDPSWIWRIRHFMKKVRPDLIFTHGVNGALVAAVAGAGLGIPIVSSWHGEYFPNTTEQKLRKPFFDLGLKLLFRAIVKEIVTVSDFSRQILIRKGVNPKKITVIHNGIPDSLVDLGSRRRIREELNESENNLLVGCACRFDVQKGLPLLLQAAALVIKERRKIRFVLWGDGPLRQSLLSMVSELGITQYVDFPGYRPDIDQCLLGLDIFVMSSVAEYFSIGLLEAMRASLPIVATNVGGNPEAIENGVHGLIVPYGDPGKMAEAILTLADDAELRKRLGRQARQRFLNEFTADKMVGRTAAWLMECARKYEQRFRQHDNPV